MSSGSGNGGFGRRVRAEWWLRSSHRARVPSGHFCAPGFRRSFARAPPPMHAAGPSGPLAARLASMPERAKHPLGEFPDGRPPSSPPTLHARGIDLVDRPQHVDGREPLVGEGRERVGEPAVLAPERRRWRPGRGTKRVPLQRNRQRHVEHDCHSRSPVTPRDAEQLTPRPLLDVRGVHHGQTAAPQAHLHEPMQEVEGVIGRALRRRIVGDQRAKRVGRDDLGRREVARSEGRLPAGGDADQHDQRIGREVRSPGKRTDRRACRRSVELPSRQVQPWASQSGHISDSGIGAFGCPIARGRARPQIVEPGSPTRWTLLKWRSGRRHVT